VFGELNGTIRHTGIGPSLLHTVAVRPPLNINEGTKLVRVAVWDRRSACALRVRTYDDVR
jgi:hypothetical protein